MKAWSVIFNLFGVLLLAFMMMVLYDDIRENEKQIEEIKLGYVIDYATEAAFSASLEGGNLGINYQDLQNVNIAPENALGVFKTIILLSYDMSLSEANYNSLDGYISSAVLAVDDGYYIATPKDPSSYLISWGVKKPYAIEYEDNTTVAYNISNENWIVAKPNGGSVVLDKAVDWSTKGVNNYLSGYIGHTPDRESILTTINKQIMADINYHIKERNKISEGVYARNEVDNFVYLPSVQTVTGVNTINKPSLFTTLAGVDFAGTQTIQAQSVGGYTVSEKKRVLGFIEDGIPYYSYEGQLEDSESVETFFNSVDEAAKAGYNPHLVNLSKAIVTPEP